MPFTCAASVPERDDLPPTRMTWISCSWCTRHGALSFGERIENLKATEIRQPVMSSLSIVPSGPHRYLPRGQDGKEQFVARL